MPVSCAVIFLFYATATTEIYTLSLHDALPIYDVFQADERAPADEEDLRRVHLDVLLLGVLASALRGDVADGAFEHFQDRKSTRLNSSHTVISYAVFCLKKKKRK